MKDLLDRIQYFAETTPDRIALVDKDGARKTTYEDFWHLCRRIAAKFSSLGYHHGDTIIISISRRMEYLAVEIGALLNGLVVVPLLPEYPAERILYIHDNCFARAVIEDDFLEDLGDDSDFHPAERRPDDRALIIYTSGSTGSPKGVVFEWSTINAACSFVEGRDRSEKDHAFGLIPPLSFVANISAYLKHLGDGKTTHIISNATVMDIHRFEDYLAEHKITTTFFPPKMIPAYKNKDPYLMVLASGGERLGPVDPNPDYAILNNYGQTETCGMGCYFFVDKHYDVAPIGRPMPGVSIELITDEGTLAKDGEVGEILLTGFFAHEYHNLPELSAQTFEQLEDGRVRLHTGDMAYRQQDGNYIYVNRKDWMVKINGQRVEPGEVAAAIQSTPGVRDSAVRDFRREDGSPYLCGYYVSEDVDEQAIFDHIRQTLAPYMVPAYLQKLDFIPLNNNGKVDRHALPEPTIDTSSDPEARPENELQRILCRGFEDILHKQGVGIDDDFFALGGDSLAVVALQAACDIQGLAPTHIFSGKTPREIARLVEKDSGHARPPIRKQEEIRDEYPMSLTQRHSLEMCKAAGKTLDLRHMTLFFELPEGVDEDRLERTFKKLVRVHPIYAARMDIDRMVFLRRDPESFECVHVDVAAKDYDAFRQAIYDKIRDLTQDPLFEVGFVHVDDGRRHLYISISHAIYDMGTTINLFSEISNLYSGGKGLPEKRDFFDLISWEEELRDTPFYRAAVETHDAYYKDVPAVHLFDESRTGVTTMRPILKGVPFQNVHAIAAKHGVSILTLFQAAFERAALRHFDIDRFCYVNTYNARHEESLVHSHGAFYRYMFLPSTAHEATSVAEHLKLVEQSYQELLYYNVEDAISLVQRYPQINTGIGFNYREQARGGILLNGIALDMPFGMEDPNIARRPYRPMNVMVDFLDGSPSLKVSGFRISKEDAEKFTRLFDEEIRAVLDAVD